MIDSDESHVVWRWSFTICTFLMKWVLVLSKCFNLLVYQIQSSYVVTCLSRTGDSFLSGTIPLQRSVLSMLNCLRDITVSLDWDFDLRANKVRVSVTGIVGPYRLCLRDFTQQPTDYVISWRHDTTQSDSYYVAHTCAPNYESPMKGFRTLGLITWSGMWSYMLHHMLSHITTPTCVAYVLVFHYHKNSHNDSD